jgi:hypothetical protein
VTLKTGLPISEDAVSEIVGIKKNGNKTEASNHP